MEPKECRKYYSIGLFAIGLIFLFFGLQPLLPKLKYYFQKTTPQTEITVNASGSSIESIILPETKGDPDHRIVIPSISVDMDIIYEEENETRALKKGAWLLPRTARPNSDTGNTVITAHRYLFTKGPKTFYNLDKVKVGDQAIIRWEGIDFVYEVTSLKIVKPDNVKILAPTDEPTLTLFTCHPIFTTDKRLVVTAKLSTFSSSTQVDN